MNRILLGCALLAGVAFAGGREQSPRVEAKEATVVTVHAAQPKPQKKSRFRLGGLKALAGAANAGGWLLNTGDDIPSSRERQLRSRTSR